MTGPRVVFRHATQADFDAVFAERPRWRCLAWAGERDGELLGVGGLMLAPECPIAFALFTEAGRRFPLAMHRAGRFTIAKARELGFPRVVAQADCNIPAARRWLERLGFRLWDEKEMIYVHG